MSGTRKGSVKPCRQGEPEGSEEDENRDTGYEKPSKKEHAQPEKLLKDQTWPCYQSLLRNESGGFHTE